MSIKSRIETPATTLIKSGTQTPEGHDRNYHLKKADGSSDHHIPLIKSLLARPDVTLHEAIVYGFLLDKLGPGHTSCCPTQGTIAGILGVSVKSVERAMAGLKAKGLVTPVFAGYTNKYYLPDRHVALAKIDGQAPPASRSSGEQKVLHYDGAQVQGPSESRSSGASSVTESDITNKEYSGKQKDGGNEEGAGSAGRTPADPALSFSGNAAADIGQVSESSIETPSPSDSTESVTSTTAASGQYRNDAAAGSEQSAPAASDSILNEDIPAEHLKADWDHLQEDTRDTVLNAISSPGVRSVLLHGQPGTGKSTTAAAIILGLRDQAEQDDKDPHYIRSMARFVSQAEFTRHALNTNFLSKDEGNFGAASWNGATEGSKYVNSIMQFNGILVLDDVVHQRAPAKLAPLVIEILNHRHSSNLATIVTSNLSPAQIAQKLDPAVASRLCGGTVLDFVGEDLRRHPQKEEVRNSA